MPENWSAGSDGCGVPAPKLLSDRSGSIWKTVGLPFQRLTGKKWALAPAPLDGVVTLTVIGAEVVPPLNALNAVTRYWYDWPATVEESVKVTVPPTPAGAGTLLALMLPTVENVPGLPPVSTARSTRKPASL